MIVCKICNSNDSEDLNGRVMDCPDCGDGM